MDTLARARSRRIGRPVRRPGRLRRLGALFATAAVVTAGLVGLTAGGAAAAAETITDATFEWTVSDETNAASFNGECNFWSAGQSDSTSATYVATNGNATVLKLNASDQYVPVSDWSTRCKDKNGAAVNFANGATAKRLGQKVVFTGGTGTVDPATGASTIQWTGTFSINFYGTLVPFWIVNPKLTVDAAGAGTVTATLGGFASDMANPTVRTPLPELHDVVIATLESVDGDNTTGFTITPKYAGVAYERPVGSDQSPQNRVAAGWGAWPTPFVDFQMATGLGSYWYTSGLSTTDSKKPPAPITVNYGLSGEPGEPGSGEQTITAVVPETGPGEFLWSIDAADHDVTLTDAEHKGTYLQSTGAIKPISVTDTRTGSPTWTISGQIGDFTGGINGKHLGWTPKVTAAGAGATPGAAVPSGITSGNGLKDSSILASATSGHVGGTGSLGADLDLRLPADTPAGTYSATLTITALS